MLVKISIKSFQYYYWYDGLEAGACYPFKTVLPIFELFIFDPIFDAITLYDDVPGLAFTEFA